MGGGIDAARALVRRLLGERLTEPTAETRRKDAKTRLQEWLQGKGYPLPVYEVTAISGDDHNQVFEVACSCKAASNRQVGTASSRKKAEQKAAAAMLEILGDE